SRALHEDRAPTTDDPTFILRARLVGEAFLNRPRHLTGGRDAKLACHRDPTMRTAARRAHEARSHAADPWSTRAEHRDSRYDGKRDMSDRSKRPTLRQT